MPTAFKRHLEEQFGRDVFVTSLTGSSVLVYPLPVWTEIETKISTLAQSHPSVQKYRRNTSYFGQECSMDPQGRVLIPTVLRDFHGDLSGEVCVLGNYDHLVIWRRDQIERSITEEPFTDEDFKSLAELGL